MLDSEATRDADPHAVAAALAEAQAANLARVVDELNLCPRDRFDLSVGGGSATVCSFTNQPKVEDAAELSLEEKRAIAEGSANAMAGAKSPVAWLSALSVTGGADCLFTLTAWNLPAVSVPHLYISVGVSGGAIELCVDFRPRADAGYALRRDDGSYPEPETREMFMQASLRSDFADLYFDEPAEAWRAAVLATPGAQLAPPPLEATAAQAAGPLLLAARLPLDEAGIAAASAACAAAAARWAGWVNAAEEHEARKTMTTMAHDTKVRAACAAAAAAALSARYGSTGTELAALDAGPVDQANRGSAMNQAASSAFGDASEADMSAQDMQRLAAQGQGADASQLGGGA